MVLILIMLINLLHVYDVQRRFRTVKIEEVYQNLICSEMILEAEYEDAENNLNQIAKAIANDASDLVSEEAIIRMLENCNASGRYLGLYYVTNEGILYSDLGDRQQLEESELKERYEVEQPVIRVAQEVRTEDAYGILRYLQPVVVDGHKLGQLVAEEDMKVLFDDPAFDYLKDAGDLFLVSGSGDIYLRDTYLFMEKGERYENLFDLLFSVCADNYSKKDINLLKRLSAEKGDGGVHRHSELSSSFVDIYGMRDYVEYRTVPGILDLYLVSIYPETVYTNVTKPLLFRTLMMGCLLFLITIAMVSYMWWSSSSRQVPGSRSGRWATT